MNLYSRSGSELVLSFLPRCSRCIFTGSSLLSDSQPPSSDGNHQSSSPPAVRQYNEIPKPKFFLGVNWELIKNPKILVEYVAKQVRQYGKIYRDKGFPGIPEFLYVADPNDIEKVFRVGDKGYPMRFPIKAWRKARDELKLPYGMFLE